MSETVGWMPDPDGRGTFSLLTSCILTLGVCVWSAMHLNIPPHGESPWQYWMRNIRWGLTGIFGPELVVFIAWRQYLSARAIVNKSQERLFYGEQSFSGGQITEKVPTDMAEKATGLPEYQPVAWTVVHGFYAGMGGFVVSLDTPSATRHYILQDDCHHLTLTAQGVALLAECGLLPNIPGEDILDKSKSDGLAKLLACTQAGWMAIQIIGRLVLGLQVTLLEINTLGHVLCALVIYVFWWHKPRLIHEPTTLEGDWVSPMAAYMYMSSRMSGGVSGETDSLKPSSTDPELSSLAFFQDVFHNGSHEDDLGYNSSPTNPRYLTTRDKRYAVQGRLSIDTAQSEVVSPDQKTTKGSFGPYPVHHKTANGQREDFDHTSVSDDIPELKIRKSLRWRLAAEAFCRFPAIRRRFQRINSGDAKKEAPCLREMHPQELVTEHSGNWSTNGLLSGVGGLVMGVVLWFASMAFGAVHAAAWNDYFPTSVEAWMWRCSSIYIVASGLLWLVINLSAKMSKPFDDRWNQMRRSSAPWISSTTLAIICTGFGAAYAFARMFLVVEAFISLRQLPKGAYQTPQWTQLIPHL